LQEKELEELMQEFRQLTAERDLLMSTNAALERHVDSSRTEVQGVSIRNLSLSTEVQDRNRTVDAYERGKK